MQCDVVHPVQSIVFDLKEYWRGIISNLHSVKQDTLAANLVNLFQGKTRNLRFSFWIVSEKTQLEVLSTTFSICNLIQVPNC